jgi:hypothetical protein
LPFQKNGASSTGEPCPSQHASYFARKTSERNQIIHHFVMLAKISSYCRFHYPDNPPPHKNRVKRPTSLFRLGKIVKIGEVGREATGKIERMLGLFLPTELRELI